MSTKALYGISLLDSFGYGIILPLINSRIGELGGSLMWVGITQSATAGAQLFGSPVVGSWSDTRGRKTLLIYTLAVTLLSNVLVGVPSLAAFFLSRVLYGLSHHTDVLVKTMLADKLPPEQVSKSANKVGAILALAFTTGPIMGGVLYEKFQSYSVISLLLTSSTVLLMCISYLMVEETVKLEKLKQGALQKTFGESVAEDLGKVFNVLKTIDLKKYGDLLLIKLLSEAAFNMMFLNMRVILVTKFELKQIDIGFVISFLSFCMIPTSLSMNFMFKKFYSFDQSGLRRAIHGFTALVTVICLLPFATASILYVILTTIGVSVKVMIDALLTEILSARTTKSDKGAIMGATVSMVSVAGIVCPLISGAVGSLLGTVPLMLLPIIPSLAGVGLIRYLKQTTLINKDKKS